ncbi:hypothetical protein [Spiroplasma eriocheiris]|uniref:Uncharacterized protein n=1 Tax=Spiroplasma eriocheiris TaxID=315358 RepID=A0A0H3XKV2_9MOLU|nr:hypothetical protein [Spiroplasma eriocheiris]AHF57641.1 hypothetical protein SPE_0513 [Spiroplasma eriocheiris CCTCC M 207170]AKM54094.1 hypothetical protein SERIO_v1c05200 [Spiroplasma eriocheiris]
MKKLINLLISLSISGVMTISPSFKNQLHSHVHDSLKAFNQHWTNLGKFTFNKTKISNGKVVTYKIGNNKDLYYLDLTNPTNPISKLLFKNLGMYKFVSPNDNILIGYQIGVFPSTLQYFDLTDINHPIIKNLNFKNNIYNLGVLSSTQLIVNADINNKTQLLTVDIQNPQQPVYSPVKVGLPNISAIKAISNHEIWLTTHDQELYYLNFSNPQQPILVPLKIKVNNINEINNILPLTNNTFIISDLNNNMWYLKINNSQPELTPLHLKGLSLLSNSFIAINDHQMFFVAPNNLTLTYVDFTDLNYPLLIPYQQYQNVSQIVKVDQNGILINQMTGNLTYLDISNLQDLKPTNLTKQTLNIPILSLTNNNWLIVDETGTNWLIYNN